MPAGSESAATIAIAHAWALPAALAGRSGQWRGMALRLCAGVTCGFAAAGQLLTGGDAFGWVAVAGAAGGLLGLSAGSLIVRSRAAGMLIGAISALWVLLSGWIDLPALLGGYCYPLADLLAGAALPVLVCGLLTGRLLPARPGGTAADAAAGRRDLCRHFAGRRCMPAVAAIICCCCAAAGWELAWRQPQRCGAVRWRRGGTPWRLDAGRMGNAGHAVAAGRLFRPYALRCAPAVAAIGATAPAVVWGILAFAICAMPVLLLDWCNWQRQRAAALLGAMLRPLASVLLLWLALPALRFGHSAIACLMLISGLVWLGVALAGRSRLGWYRDPVAGTGAGLRHAAARCAGVGNARHCAADTAVDAGRRDCRQPCRHLRLPPDRCRPALAGQGCCWPALLADPGRWHCGWALGGWQEWQSWLVALLRTLLSPYFQHMPKAGRSACVSPCSAGLAAAAVHLAMAGMVDGGGAARAAPPGTQTASG